MAQCTHFRVLVFILLLGYHYSAGQTFNGQGNMLVPPGAPSVTVGITNSPCEVTGVGVLGEDCKMIEKVTLDFTHTFVGDVALFLIAPSGEVLELSSGNGGGGDNFQVTVFTDNTAQFITAGAPPYNGTFRPEGRQTGTAPPFPNTNPLGTFTFASTFNGVNADGTWILMINDYVPIDVGLLNSWSITFNQGGGPEPEVSLGPDITICPNESVTLNAEVTPSADSYMWNTGATSSSINVTPSATTDYMVTVTNNGCIDADTITVFVSSAGINANAGPDVSICQGAGTTLNGSGGPAGSTYTWSTGQTSQSINVMPAGTTVYTLTVSNGGCSSTDQVVVTVTPPPVADAGLPQEICDGENVMLTATGGTQNNHYTWSTGQTGASITVSPNGTTIYTVTVTINGCSDTDDVEVTVNPSPTVDAGLNEQICLGESVTLTADASGGTYMWSTGQSGSQITVSPNVTTVYTVTVTDNGCTSSDQVTVTVTNLIAGITPDTEICEGDDINLTATGGTSYQWSTGQTSSTIVVSPVNTTTYSVTVSQGACMDEASVEVTVRDNPIAFIEPVDEICAGSSATLIAGGGFTYAWNTGHNTAIIDVSPMITTDYTVTVSEDGCSSTATITVDVNPSPTADAGPNQNICDEGTADLLATGLSGPGMYEWSTGQSTAAITVMPAVTTTYSVTVTNQWNCQDTDDVIVTVNPIPTANAGVDTMVCSGEDIVLTATGGSQNNQYSWSNGDSGASITVAPSNSTTYTVTVSVNGCADEASVEVVVNPAPTANTSGDETICNGEGVTLSVSGGTDVEWSTGETTNSITVVPAATTTYQVTVTNNFGCEDKENVTVTVINIPVANAGPDQMICEGETATLTGSGATSLLWSTGETDATITVSPVSTTTYNLIVTDANGCSATDEVIVTVNDIPTANAGNNEFIVAGGTATLTATGGGTYVWSTGETTAQINVSPAVTTVYTVTVTLNGCSSTDDVTVFVNEAPAVDLGSDYTICEGESVTLDAFVPGPFTLSYTWNTSEKSNTITVSPSDTTIYSVTVTDTGSGLISVDSITVFVLHLPLGTPVINGEISPCQNDIAAYTVNALSGATSYDWTIPAGATILSGQGTTSININWGTSGGGLIQLVVSNDCGQLPVATIDVSVQSSPAAPSILGQTEPCANGSSAYSVVADPDITSFNWSLTGGGMITSGQGSAEIQIDWQGSIGGQVCLELSNVCGTSISSCINVITTTTPSIAAGADQQVCGLFTTLEGSGTGTWTILNGVGTGVFADVDDPASTIDVTMPGVYTLQYEYNQNGCAASDEVVITFLDEPLIINETTDCDDTNQSYNVSFEITGGTPPYFISGNQVAGNIFVSSSIISGNNYSFQVVDANLCESQIITGSIECLCSTSIGTLDASPLKACIGETIKATYLGGEILDANDVIGYVLHDGSFPAGVVAWNTIPEFDFQSPMQTGVTYFISVVAGDDDNGLPLINDPCLSVSAGVPVTFYDIPVAMAGEDRMLRCDEEQLLLSSIGSSTGPEINYLWSTSDGLLDGLPSNPAINALSGGTYFLQVRNNTAGCLDRDTVIVTESTLKIDGLIVTSVPPVCAGECNATIEITSTHPEWLFGFNQSTFSDATSVDDACSGSFTIFVKDTAGCIQDTVITIPSTDPIAVDLGPDITITLGDSAVLTATSPADIISYNWFQASTCTICPQISVTPGATNVYSVQVTDQDLCTASDVIIVEVELAKDVYVPTVISPNGDGINDRFVIQGSQDFQVIDLIEIFDRWGNKLYAEVNLTPGDHSRSWDGYFKGKPVNPGVYVYKLVGHFEDGKPVLMTGDVTVVR